MQKDQIPLYVRLSPDPHRRLELAASASGRSKRQIVEDAVRAHLDGDGLVVGGLALREVPPEILTLGEAAEFLRTTDSDLERAAARGEVPGRRIGEGWRFSRAALLAWLATATGSGAASPEPSDPVQADSRI